MTCIYIKQNSSNSNNNNSLANAKLADQTLKAETVSNSGNSAAVPQLLAVGPDQSTQQQQVVTFVDNTPDTQQIFESISDPTFTSDTIPNAELGNFLERPVLIATVRWSESVPYTESTIDPWNLYFTHTIIKKKIDNYAFINCNLHVKVVVNASPFYYGAMMVSYRPMTNYGLPDYTTISVQNDYMRYSQRPHFWVLPQSNMGGEMQLPFFYNHNWLPLTDTAALSSMGTLRFTEVVDLKNANSVTGQGIDVQVYAWASNIKLAGPTFELQSGKKKNKKQQISTRNVRMDVSSTSEYEVGPVEKVASSVANIASKLTEVPVIGSFAKATEYGAKALSGIASLFGWTNVPVISNVEPMKNVPFHALCSAEIGTPVEKLTLDPKNELTIDPRTVGLQGDDELSIVSMVTRESYLTTFVWNETQASGDQLFIATVNPTQYFESGISANQSCLTLTPMALVANLFQYWRGDIIFRFKAICTQYHKGRLRITWDPLTNLCTNANTTETSFTKIVDLAPDMDVEICVSYLQKRVYLRTAGLNGMNFEISGFTKGPQDYTDNGSISVRILNDLTGPSTGATVSLMVFVRGCDNLSFSDPKDFATGTPAETLSYFTVQSGREIVDANAQYDDVLTTIIGGEATKSLRVLMRRSHLAGWVSMEPFSGDGSSDQCYYSVAFQKLPEPYGFLASAPNTVTGLVSGVTEQFSYGRHSAVNIILPCFVGYRGSTMVHINVHSTNKVLTTLLVERHETAIPQSGGIVTPVTKTLQAAGTVWSALTREPLRQIGTGASGIALTNQETQTGLSFLCPHYYNTRMADTNPEKYLLGSDQDESDTKHYTLLMYNNGAEDANMLQSVMIEKYMSIGPDFNAFFFLNVPALWRYTAIPTAV